MATRSRLNWRNQAVLAGTLFALGLGAYWLEFKRKPARESADEQSKKVFSLKDRQIQSVALLDPKGPRASFEFSCVDVAAKLCKPGDNSKWQLQAPLKFKADDSNVNSLVSTFNNLNATEVIDLKEETTEKRQALLKEYGLDAEVRKGTGARKVKIVTDAGAFVAHFGNTHPIGDSIFAVVEKDSQVDEMRVFVVPSYFKSQFDHDITFWRDKKIFSFASNDVTGFELSGGKASIVAVRADGGWTLRSGTEELPGDIENIDNLISAIAFLSAKGFSDARALQGAKKVLTLKISTAAPIVLTLHGKGDLKKPTGKLYATVAGLDPVFELDPYTLDRLNKSPKDLRLTKLITSMDRFGARKLEWSGKSMGEGVTQVSKDGKWTIQGGGKEISTTEKTTQLLDKLSGNRIREFLTGSVKGAGEPDGVTLKLFNDKELKRHLVFWKSGPKLYGRDLLAKRKEALEIDPALISDLPWSRDDLLTPQAAPSQTGTP